MGNLTKALLLTTALTMPMPANAVPVLSFFAGLGLATSTSAAVAAALFPGFFAVGVFFTTTVGSLLLSLGLSALTSRSQAPKISDARINVRLEAAPRWQAGGSVMVGGSLGTFVEHDEAGNLWYIIAHADSELTGTPTYFLDSIEVVLSDGTDGFTAGDVITDEFCLTTNGEVYTGSGTRVPVWRLYTVTPSASAVYGAKPAAFTTAFPDLPTDFYLAGVAYTIIRGKAVEPQHYSKAYHWSGGLRLGEPTVATYANFSRMYDPRELGHDIDDPDTWTPSNGNPMIVWAWWRTHAYGRGMAMADIAWDQVEEWADICDTTVLDRNGDPVPLYRCGVAFPDNRPRQECEAEILATMDAFVAYDDAGLVYAVPGYYVAPTLTFTKERDILTAETQIIRDGESPLDGVVVTYVSPDHGYTPQPAPPWVNTEYYDGTSEPNYLPIEILGCQNVNQAVRLGKAIGQRIAPPKRAAFGCSIKGILATRERAVTATWDATFTGVFEIATPVEEDETGQYTSFAVVPLASDRWTLGVGEEGAPPAPTPLLNIDTTLEVAANVVITAETIQFNAGVGVRLRAAFDAPSRPDRAFRFRYALTGETVYEYFATDMDELIAYSALVDEGATFDVQWQTITAGGRATDWSTIEEITATVTPVAIGDLVDPGADGNSRSVTGLPDGTQLVLGDGEWWRRVSDGTIVTAARYVALFDLEEYQVERVPGALSTVLGLTRATTGTYIDADGVVQTAAIDVPRIDHSLGDGALLVEPAAENLHTYSSQFDDASWSLVGGTTVAANAVTGPDGTSSGDTVTSGNAALQAIFDVVTVVAGETYTSSVWVKLGTMAAAGFKMAVRDESNAAWIAQDIVPTVTPSASIWQRLSYVWAAPAGCTSARFAPFRNTVAVAGTFHLWNAQTELGSVATSDIVTGASAVTRAADVATMLGVTATLDLSVRYGDGSDVVLAAQSVTPGFWPTFAQTRITRIVGRV